MTRLVQCVFSTGVQLSVPIYKALWFALVCLDPSERNLLTRVCLFVLFVCFTHQCNLQCISISFEHGAVWGMTVVYKRNITKHSVGAVLLLVNKLILSNTTVY
jgi:hypothetical protein